MAKKESEASLTVSTTIKVAKQRVLRYATANIPCYVEGPPGVGKSEMAKQIADELGIGFIDVRLAQLDPVDLRGLPSVVQEKGTRITAWARPDMWPVEERDGKRGIMLLDELGDCGKAMQSAAYQVVLDRKAGPHEIPPGWYVMGAGNSQKHKAGAQAMSTALANRMAHIEVEANPECWLEYGNKVGFHHFVLGFIKMRPAMLFTMDGCEGKAFASPRTWAKVSLLCDAPSDEIFGLVSGLVGPGPGSEFTSFLKTIDLPDIEEILANPKGCRIPKEPSSKYALSSMLARYAKRDNLDKIMAYMKRDQFGRDFEIASALDASKRDAGLCETKAWVEFANRNQDLQL